MKARRLVALAILFAPLLAASCGGGSDDSQPRSPNAPYATTTRPAGVGPETQTGPPPQNMPGGGRGFDPPHFKGKP